MLTIALVAVLVTLALMLLSLGFLNRRAAKVADVRSDVEKEITLIQRRDAENDHELLNHLLEGLSPDEALRRYQEGRAKLLPAGNLQNPADWTGETLDSYRREQIERGVEQVNRRLILPAGGLSLALIAGALVVCTVLYQFSSSGSYSTAGPGPAPTSVLAPTPNDIAIPPAPAFPAPISEVPASLPAHDPMELTPPAADVSAGDSPAVPSDTAANDPSPLDESPIQTTP